MVVPPGKVLIEPGEYIANVAVSFPASLVASSNLLENGIKSKGFATADVVDVRPDGWPLKGDADYFVHTTWTGQPTLFDLPKQVTAHQKVA